MALKHINGLLDYLEEQDDGLLENIVDEFLVSDRKEMISGKKSN